MRAIFGRLKRLEQVRAVELVNRPVEVQLGYTKKLQPEYTGERHVMVARLPNGHYRWTRNTLGPDTGSLVTLIGFTARLAEISPIQTSLVTN
jgi:hypothetical protein